MLNNKDTIVSNLRRLGLTRDESLVYISLLHSPKSHLELSRDTNVNRTKVYRIADDLTKKSLAGLVTDDTGTKLVAKDPGTLEVELVNAEQELRSKQAAFRITLPMLKDLTKTKGAPEHFEVLTYEGVTGFKQMLWHELKTKDELLVFDSADIDDLVDSARWAEKHRHETTKAGYKSRAIVNTRNKTDVFTKNQDFMESYDRRELPHDSLNISNMIVIYNDTVATYCHAAGQKVGYEVVNKANAEMMRQVFEQYWAIAK
jgi:sugar-specific transcriptional regulator TrmB